MSEQFLYPDGCECEVVLVGVRFGILSKKGLYLRDMLRCHVVLPDGFKCLDEYRHELSAIGKVLGNATLESDRGNVEVDAAGRSGGEIDIVHRHLGGEAKHVLCGCSGGENLRLVAAGNRSHDGINAGLEVAESGAYGFVIDAIGEAHDLAFSHKFGKLMTDELVVAVGREVRNEEDLVLLRHLNPLGYVVLDAHESNVIYGAKVQNFCKILY